MGIFAKLGELFFEKAATRVAAETAEKEAVRLATVAAEKEAARLLAEKEAARLAAEKSGRIVSSAAELQPGEKLVQSTLVDSAGRPVLRAVKEADEAAVEAAVKASETIDKKGVEQLIEETAGGDATRKGFLRGIFESAASKKPFTIYYGKGDLATKLGALSRVAAKGDEAATREAAKYADILLQRAAMSKTGITAQELSAIKALVKDGSPLGKSILADAEEICTERLGKWSTLPLRASNFAEFAKSYPVRASGMVLGETTKAVGTTAFWGVKSAWWVATHPTKTAMIAGGLVAADMYFDDGRLVNVAKENLVDPLIDKATGGVKSLLNKGANELGLPNLFNTSSDGNDGNNAGNNNDGAGEPWYASLKKYASRLTGGWAILGMILNVVAWIGEALSGLAGSLFSSDTKVQTNNPDRVAGVQRQAGTGQTMQASTFNHNGAPTRSILDLDVPQLAPT